MPRAKKKGTKPVTTSAVSEQVLSQIRDAAQRCFQYHAGDMLNALQAEGINHISRDIAIETVLDAGRIEDEFPKIIPASQLKDVLTWWEGLTYTAKIAVVRPVFKFARYS